MPMMTGHLENNNCNFGAIYCNISVLKVVNIAFG